jgi:hypothetical protein
VLEDDAYPADDLAQRSKLFFSRVPADWDCLMLGAEHLLPPIAVGPGVVRCAASIRCHAYAVRGPLMRMLSVFWQANQTDHCDLVLSSLMPHYKAYAPDPPLIGQDAGLSDITTRDYPLRFFARPAVVQQTIAKISAQDVRVPRPMLPGVVERSSSSSSHEAENADIGH